MNIPFTSQQFFDLFETYNRNIWPSQLVACLLGLFAVWFAWRGIPTSSRICSAILAAFWIWIGVFYHIRTHGRRLFGNSLDPDPESDGSG